MGSYHIVGVFVRNERHVTTIPKADTTPQRPAWIGQTYRFVHVGDPRARRILIVAVIALVYSRDRCWE